MNEKPVKLEIDFNEALRRVANSPKKKRVRRIDLTKDSTNNTAAALKKLQRPAQK